MNRGEIKTEVLVRSGKDTTSAWTSEAFLNDWINQEHKWAAGYKPWVFTEGRISTTYTGVEEWNFEGYRPDSIKHLEIGGDRFQKVDFESYKIYKEEQPSGTDKFYTDYANTLFINTLSGASGTLTAWGQFVPADVLDGDENDNTETIFNSRGQEGNDAIIERVLARIANRDGKLDEANAHLLMAKNNLDTLWQRLVDSQYNYQMKDRGMWERIDVLEGGYFDDSFNTDQF